MSSSPSTRHGHSRVGGENEINSDHVWRPFSGGFSPDASRRTFGGVHSVSRARQLDGADGRSLLHLNARKPGRRAMCGPWELGPGIYRALNGGIVNHVDAATLHH